MVFWEHKIFSFISKFHLSTPSTTPFFTDHSLLFDELDTDITLDMMPSAHPEDSASPLDLATPLLDSKLEPTPAPPPSHVFIPLTVSFMHPLIPLYHLLHQRYLFVILLGSHNLLFFFMISLLVPLLFLLINLLPITRLVLTLFSSKLWLMNCKL